MARVQEESNLSNSRDEANSQGRNAPPLAQGRAGLFQVRAGSRWKKISVYPAAQGCLQLRNIITFQPGPTSYSASRVLSESIVSLFRVLFNGAKLINVKKYTVAERRKKTGNDACDVTLHPA